MAEPATPKSAPSDIRPVVRTGNGSNWGVWAFAAILLLGGVWLFSALSANRLGGGAPSTAIPGGYGAGRIASPNAPELPDRFFPRELPATPDRVGTIAIEPEPRTVVTRPVTYPRAETLPEPVQQYVPIPRAPNPATASFGDAPAPGPTEGAGSDSSAQRVSADRLANPSFTVPLGTVIPAVLESALDSTRPGGVRAIVQRDIFSFDGSRVLIQRGTRLYGEYEADLERGQNRALIRWTRLLRPDGVTMALDSAASDPLGRAGVRGKVDSKFFQRFGNAILGSALDIGVGLATREVGGGTVVALPGSTQNIGGQRGEEIQPTLKVKHGTSVSVYVARDLDFSSVET